MITSVAVLATIRFPSFIKPPNNDFAYSFLSGRYLQFIILLTDFKISNILVNYFSVQHGTIQLTL